MKGVVLAGGLGTRFHPVTKVVNKHLLDVYDEPVVFFPIRTLVTAGITDLVLVTLESDVDQFKRLLGDGSDLGARIEFATQGGAGGIAEALLMAEPLVKGDRVAAILGDNIFQDTLQPFVERFESQESGAMVLLKRVSLDDAKRFGVVELGDDKVTRIVEKPAKPMSDLIQTGFYLYDERVFDFIRRLAPSDRGELEITDLNSLYVKEGSMTFDILKGWWTDAGTPASKLKASILVALEKGVHFHR